MEQFCQNRDLDLEESIFDSFYFIKVVGVTSTCKVTISVFCYFLATLIFFSDNHVLLQRVHNFSLLLIAIKGNTPMR